MSTLTTPHPPVTRDDLRKPELTVAEVMRTDFRSCNAGDPVADVAAALRQSGGTFVAVTRAQVPLGVITEGALAAALAAHGGDLSRLTAGDVMIHERPTIPAHAPLAEAANRLAGASGRLLAVDADGLLTGVLTLAELAPQLSEFALGRLIGRLAREGSEAMTPAEAARAADPTAEIKPSKSQAQPHPWDPPLGTPAAPVPLVSPSDLVNPLLKVSDAMTANPRTGSPFSTALEAVLIFRDAGCGVIPVTEDGRPVGVVTDRDVALALADHEHDLGATPLERLMTRDVVTIRADDSLDTAIASLREHGIGRLLVVDSGGLIVGVLSWTDLAPHLTARGLAAAFGR